MSSRFFLAVSGFAVLLMLFLFGKTTTVKTSFPHSAPAHTFNIEAAITIQKQRLTAAQLMYVSKLENGVTRGDVKLQTEKQFRQLAQFWNDTIHSFTLYAYYLSEASKLDNSEKNLNFAARLILDNMRREDNVEVKSWKAQTAASLFEQALKLDPDNDDLKVGLGSCYVYGEGMAGNPQETMKGIQQLLQVVKKDSNNMQAQMVLGIGAVISRQFDKAVQRLSKVVSFDPQNLEAVSWLADAYAGEGDKINAVKWYEQSKKLVNNPAFSKEMDERIKNLQTEP